MVPKSKLSKREQNFNDWRLVYAFFRHGLNGEGTDKVARMAATAFNENGATTCLPSGTLDLTPQTLLRRGWSRPCPSSSMPC